MSQKILFSPAEAAAAMQAGKAVLIDIRAPEAYRAGHIAGAVNVPDVFSYLAETSPSGLQALHDQFAELFGRAGLDG